MQNYKFFLTLVTIVMYSILLSGCGDFLSTNTLPRCSDEGFLDWLNGKEITLEKGFLFNSTWQLEKGEISDFKVLRVTENSVDKIYTATVSFKATAKGSGVNVSEAMIRYRQAPDKDKLKFVDFTPVTAFRIGN